MSHKEICYSDLVDPFIGTEAVALPTPEGIAAAWFYLKAQIGNTHPGASLPFSVVSACPYSGAYPTGYGVYDINTHGTPLKLYRQKCAFGVTHVHQSGTGGIQHYYNYLLTIPFVGDRPAVPEIDLQKSRPFVLTDELARPGYYSGYLKDIDVGIELTVGDKSAAHLYRYKTDGTAPRGIIVDVTNGGLAPARAALRAVSVEVEIGTDGSCTGTAVLDDIPWHFAIVRATEGVEPVLWSSDGAGTSSSDGWIPVEKLNGTTHLVMDAKLCRNKRGGVVFDMPEGDECGLFVGLSLDSPRTALAAARKTADRGFCATREAAARMWEGHLSRIHVDGLEKDRRIFYTALYHSLLKPVEADASNWIWRDGPALYSDFATMWDQYKTHLPLVFAVCPERITPIVDSLLELHKSIGKLPPATLFCNDFSRFYNQSRALCHVTLFDAFQHITSRDSGLSDGEKANWLDVAQAMAATLGDEAGSVKPGKEVQSYSHLLDISIGAYCTLRLAETLGAKEVAAAVHPYLDWWIDAFDPDTGMMREGEYYEAGNVSYSFRLLPRMASRIALCGGRGAFLERLDRYFGFGAPPVDQLCDPPWDEKRAEGLALGRFDGVNNEVAMETPFAYAYVDAFDPIAEITRCIMRFHYNDSTGGLPGNDDSGALSSWFVWSSIGLFPVPGQGIFIIGSPIFDSVRMTLGEKRFSIIVEREHDSAIYLKDVFLNGAHLKRGFLCYSEVLGGGKLVLRMTGEKGTFIPEEDKLEMS